MKISDEVLSGLRLLQQICAEENRNIILIGATVPQILIDLEERRTSGSRETRDVDTIIEINSWSDYDAIKNKLIQAGFRQGDEPHALQFGQDARFDLLPYGSQIVKNDRILWRDTGREMSAVGFEEAFQSARPKTIAPGLSVSVVSIPALVILKITAYLDRPEERVRDMVDLVYCLAEYERSGDQRFELTGEEVHGQPLYFEEAGAFLVGEQVARLAGPKARSRVNLFLEQLTDEFARPINQILAQEKRLEEEPRREDLFRLLQTFSVGFERL